MKNILLAFLVLTWVSCGESFQKMTFLNSYSAFVEDVSKNGASFDDKKWEEIQQKFTRFNETDYPKLKPALTDEEQKKYNELTGRYYGALARHQASRLKKEFDGLLDQTQGVLDELRK